MSAPPILYYVTDRTAFAADEPTRRRRLLEKIAEAARAGVDYIQLREKDLPTRELELLAREVVQAIREARLATGHRSLTTAHIINSRSDIALAAAADGVHLRSDDISPQEVIAIWKKCVADAPFDRLSACPELAEGAGSVRQLSRQAPLIGVSCHSPSEVQQAAANGATFAVFGPAFEKQDTPEQPATGLAALRDACRVQIPVLALGGITLKNAKSCLEVGAAGIAAIRLFQENDISEVVRSLRTL